MGLRVKTLGLVAGLLCIGLVAASPFLTRRLVGTGESFNYSLSIADAVSQVRSGIVPPLVGQTEYAFNGRIHPLRTAPYLSYLAGAIDAVSLHKLSFWQIQNASLAFSIVAAVFACYIGLRRGVDCPRFPSFLLAAAYGFSPALLGAAYSFDLYMTVHAAVFVPLAVGACMRGCLRPTFRADACLAAAVSAAWLAHPPVAFWLTAGVLLVRGLDFVRRPRARALASGIGAAVLAAGLSAYVFASTASLQPVVDLHSKAQEWGGVTLGLLQIVRDSFPASLLPVGREAGGLNDLQFGYVPWILFGFALAMVLRSPALRDGEAAGNRASAFGSIVVALLLALTLPVPGLTSWMWHHVPGIAVELTSLWPMQRVYLVAVPFALFSAALVLPRVSTLGRRVRWVGRVAVAGAAVWTLHEARPFISRGFRDRWYMETTQGAYRPSNLDLTVTSYAFFGVPPTYVNGVVDPQYELRFLRGGTDEIGSPFDAPRETAPVVDRGVFKAGRPMRLTLQPDRRYLLTFAFLTPPLKGNLEFVGPLIHRIYNLPAAGSSEGFGMLGGQPRSISVWTDGDGPELIEVHLNLSETDTLAGRDFAQYTLQEVRPSDLPIRLVGLLPLHFTADAPGAGYTVETPRQFLFGYEATVNGRPMRTLVSPNRQVMVPVPPGHSDVVVRYRGSSLVLTSFWLSAACWFGFFAWIATGSRISSRPFLAAARPAFATLRLCSRHRAASCVAVVVVLGAILGLYRRARHRAYLEAVGPVQIDFTLPYGLKGASQPLLSTGHPNAGAVVIVTYLDEKHIRLSADVWGRFFQSAPIELDFSQVQSLVVSDSALFPQDHPMVQALTPAEIRQRRNELRIELNGRTVIHEACYAYESALPEIHVGSTRFVSMTDPSFLGDILGVKRLPIPRSLGLPAGRHARLVVTFPMGRSGSSEPLLCLVSADMTRECYVTYLSRGRIRITCWGPAGVPLESGECTFDPAKSHVIDIEAGDTNSPAPSHQVSCEFDGVRLFGGSQLQSAARPPAIDSGINRVRAPGVDDRFTGSQMELTLPSDTPQAGPAPTHGAVHMILTLPENETGRHEPLLTTGRTGAGDLVYLIYEDDHHVRVGFDHWGVGGITSDPIRVDYGLPHEVWIGMSSLNETGVTNTGSPVTVVLDGQTAVASKLVPYPTTASEVTVGKNGIGGSTADPDFNGSVLFVERTGTASPPSRGL
jgi:hypothetical protein